MLKLIYLIMQQNQIYRNQPATRRRGDVVTTSLYVSQRRPINYDTSQSQTLSKSNLCLTVWFGIHIDIQQIFWEDKSKRHKQESLYKFLQDLESQAHHYIRPVPTLIFTWNLSVNKYGNGAKTKMIVYSLFALIQKKIW